MLELAYYQEITNRIRLAFYVLTVERSVQKMLVQNCRYNFPEVSEQFSSRELCYSSLNKCY